MAFSTLPDCSIQEPNARFGHAAVYCNNVVYLWGGITSSLSKMHDGPAKKQLMSELFVFNPLTCDWTMCTASGNPPLGVRDFAAVAYGSDRLIQFGGYCGHDNCLHNSLHVLYMNNCLEPKWEELLPTTSHRKVCGAPMMKQDCGMVCYEDSRGSTMLCVFGGAGRSGSSNQWKVTNEIHVTCLSNQKSECCWSIPDVSGHSPPPCHGFSFTKIGKQKVMLFGGRIGQEVNGPLSNQLYTLGLDTMSWSQIQVTGPEWPSCREAHSASFIGRHLLIVGGLDDKSEALDEIWTYDISTSSWKQIAKDIPTGFKKRGCHSMNTVPTASNGDDDGTASVMIFGGVSRYLRKEQQNKQPMVANTVIIGLDSCDSESDSLTVKLAFDLSYIGRQFYSLFLNHKQGLVMKNEEIDNLRKQLTQASNEIEDLKNRETKTKHQFHQLYSQLSLDQQDFGRDESTVSQPVFKQRSQSLPNEESKRHYTLDQTLTSSDTKNILEAIDDLTEWYALGIGLGLYTSTLDTIAKDCDNVFKCKAKVIQYWLKHSDSCRESSWRTLMDTVSGTLIKNHTLATNIDENYIR